MEGRKEGNVLFNDALNTFYIYGYMEGRKYMDGRKEGNVLFNDTLNTFYIYGYMEENIWMEGRKEGNVLFNDTKNIFYLGLYGRKEMFYLTMHSTHFIYRKEGNVVFNNTFNTFYLWLYGRKEVNILLTTHSTHFIYGYMASDICDDAQENQQHGENLQMPFYQKNLMNNSSTYMTEYVKCFLLCIT